jgi:hypothetical protein
MSEIRSELILSSWELQIGNRWGIEQQKLHQFPTFKFVGIAGAITAAEGALDTQNNNTYGLRIELKNFPYEMPRIFPKGWTLHPFVPHTYSDGSLCIMKPSQWMKHYSVAMVIAKAAIWLGKYEIWKRNGHDWPGLEQRH